MTHDLLYPISSLGTCDEVLIRGNQKKNEWCLLASSGRRVFLVTFFRTANSLWQRPTGSLRARREQEQATNQSGLQGTRTTSEYQRERDWLSILIDRNASEQSIATHSMWLIPAHPLHSPSPLPRDHYIKKRTRA